MNIRHHTYRPFTVSSLFTAHNSQAENYAFASKERDTETGLSYFGARYYSSELSIWLSVDPMVDKYPSLSPYVYCANNPVKLVDPNGEEIEVVSNEDGTYTVTGGTINKDKNIYIVKDGKRTGETLGQAMTEYSFFDEEGNAVVGAVVNKSDKSGQKFLDDIKNSNPGLVSYAVNARHGGKYDFKTFGGESDKNTNRGMPVNVDGKTVFASARDVGNYAAGYVSGRKGLSWTMARCGFDGYQTGFWNAIRGNWTSESMNSQAAQRVGFNVGVHQRKNDISFKMQMGPIVPHLKR